MSQTKPLIDTLKKELKKQRKTYRDVALVLGLSETSVKRLFVERSFSIGRLDKICEMLEIEISDLVKAMELSTEKTSQLTVKQEQELVADTGLLIMAHFLMMGWTFQQIIAVYDITETQGIQYLAKLDRMKLIQLLPGNRVRMLLANNFEWISHGPIQRFFESRVQTEFMEASFSGNCEYRVFLSGMLTQDSMGELIRRLKRASAEFETIRTDDASVPLGERVGTSLLMAIRPWSPEAFDSFRRSTKTERV